MAACDFKVAVYNARKEKNFSKKVIHFGFWELLYNEDFKPVEFDRFRKLAGLNSFVMSPKKWIESTNAIGTLAAIKKVN